MPMLNRAPIDIVEFVRQVVEAYHPDLTAAEVRIDVIMATATEREAVGPPPYLKLRGHTVAGLARIIPYKQRVKGNGDAEITIDAASWFAFDEDERTALIEHEARHFALVVHPKTKEVKVDKCGRPTLRTRHHDWELGGFAESARMHKGKAIEVQEFHRVLKEYQQVLFGWASDQAPQDERPGDVLGAVRAAV